MKRLLPSKGFLRVLNELRFPLCMFFGMAAFPFCMSSCSKTPNTVAYYKSHTAERDEVLKKCDHNTTDQNCLNAVTAATVGGSNRVTWDKSKSWKF